MRNVFLKPFCLIGAFLGDRLVEVPQMFLKRFD